MPPLPMTEPYGVRSLVAAIASRFRPSSWPLVLAAALTALACAAKSSAPKPAQPVEGKAQVAQPTNPEPRDPKVIAKVLRSSAHKDLDCSECHSPHGAGSRLPGEGGRTVAAVDCKHCHEEEAQTFSKSIHATAQGHGNSQAATCPDCHGSHNILSQDNPASQVFKANLPLTCGHCHGDAELAEDLGIRNPRAGQHYADSIHGRHLLKERDTGAPSCIDCHGGGHRTLRAASPESSVHRSNVVATCAACHKEQRKAYDTGIHGQKFAASDSKAPVCVDCHTAHEVAPTQGHVRLRASVQCGRCHKQELGQYARSYHGRLHQRGRHAAAGCFDCHGAHDIRPVRDPRSTLALSHRAATCRKCHTSASGLFASFVAHGDPDDRRDYPLLFWTARIVTAAMVLIAALWGLILLLWVARTLLDAWRDPLAFRRGVDAWYDARRRRFHPRLRRVDRVCLAVLSVAFLIQVATGVPLKFSDAAWANVAFRVLGDATTASTLHRVGAVLAIVTVLVHLATLLGPWWRWRPSTTADGRLRTRPSLLAYVLGADSPLTASRDLRGMAVSVLWLLGQRSRPESPRFGYWEKLGTSLMLAGGVILVFTGLLLWFPETLTMVVPGWFVNIAQIVHSQGALLAVGAVLVFYVPFRVTEAKLGELSRQADEADLLASLPPGVELTSPPKGHPLVEAWLVLVLSLVFGAALAAVELGFGGKAGDLQLALDQVPTLVPGAKSGEPDESAVPGRQVVRALDGGGKLVGWVVSGQGQGYADKVDVLVGLDPKASQVTGVYVLRHKETPGLTDGLTSPEFLGQFAGIGTDQTLDARQAPADKATGVIQALTGATISSDAVCTIVNETVAAAKAPLASAAK